MNFSLDFRFLLLFLDGPGVESDGSLSSGSSSILSVDIVYAAKAAFVTFF